MRSMKFSFGTIPESAEVAVKLSKLAEQLSLDYAWFADQTFYSDVYVMLGLCAVNTNRIGLGVGVTNPYTRHPAMTARAIATVDEISGGRTVLGIGAGNRRELLAPLGVDLGNAAARCRDTAIIVRSLLSGKTVNFENENFKVKGVKLDFKPRPDMPVYLAGRGAKILEAAGEVADGAVIGAFASTKSVRYALDNIKKGLAKKSRSLEEIDIVSWIGIEITDDRKTALERRKPSVAHIVGGANIPTLRAIGLEDGLINKLKEAYMEGGQTKAAKHIPTSLVEEFSIIGTPEECAERIDLLRDAGIKHFAALLGGELEERLGFLKTYAAKIIPKIG